MRVSAPEPGSPRLSVKSSTTATPSPASAATASASAAGSTFSAKIAGTPVSPMTATRSASSAELGSPRVVPPGMTVATTSKP